MSLKVNINKIHSDLLQNFEEVNIVENSSLSFGEYVELKATNENNVSEDWALFLEIVDEINQTKR